MLSKWQLRNPPNPTPKCLENIFRGAITSLLPVRNNAFLISISDASLFLKICNSWKIPKKMPNMLAEVTLEASTSPVEVNYMY